MTAANYLTELDVLRDRAERAALKVTEAESEARRAETAYEEAAACVDVADDTGSPHVLDRARSELDAARNAHDEVTASVEDAEALQRAAERALDQHEAKAREVFDQELKALRRDIRSVLDALADEWNVASAALGVVVSMAADLRNAVGQDFLIPPELGVLTGERFHVLPTGVDAMIENVRVPKFATGGVASVDRLVDSDHAHNAINGARFGQFSELAQVHADLAKLAGLIGRLRERRTAA